jgi:hypothetical protein
VSDAGSVREIHGIENVISGFNIANSLNVRAGEVNQAIAAAASQNSVLAQDPESLLASRVTAQAQPTQPAGDAATQSGAQMTTGMYLQCLRESDRSTLTTAATTRMEKIRDEQSFRIETENFGADRIIPRMNHGFAQACSRAAEQGSIFIMRGVNPDSLGKGGVLTHPERYAPKPMTCHAKSSYFGFTKGLVPANPQFSRPDYVNTEGDKYRQALNDVKHTLGEAMAGTEEGSPLHLKVPIEQQECSVYQGTFSKDGTNYRYQVAIPAGTSADAVQQAIQTRLQDREHLGSFLKVYKDPDLASDDPKWEEVTDFSTMSFSEADFAQAQPTLVIGIPSQSEEETPESRGSQQTTERYYVSDYDVYAIAHTTAVEATDTLIAQNEFLRNTWPNCGEFADNRDITAINFVNALLLASGTADPQAALQQYQNNYTSNHRDRPIQHAAAAAGKVETTATGGLKGFAVPDFPLWVVESGNVIKLENAGDLAAYMVCLANGSDDLQGNTQYQAILNSKVLDHCVNELMSSQPAAAA